MVCAVFAGTAANPQRLMLKGGLVQEPQEPKINQSSPIDLLDTSLVQPRAIGAATLSVRADTNGTTRLVNLRQSGSSKLVFPNTYRPDAEVVIVNTAGGVTGGDQFELDICVEANAALTVTTQAAERAYRAQRGEVGHITSALSVKSGGHLNWLPQELILFERCNLHRRLDIDMEPGARLLMVESVVFGRTAMREALRDIRFCDRIKITRDGHPLYIDGMDLFGDVATHLARPSIADGANAMASVVMVAPDAESYLAAIRAMLPASAGASMLGADMLVVRHLARDGFELRQSLIPVLEHLTQNTLPMSWRL